MSLTSPKLLGEEALAVKKMYLEALRDKGLVSHALDIAGITLQQLQTFREDPIFADLERQAELFQDDKLRDQINQYIAQGDKQIIVSAMKRLPEYNPSKKTEVSVSGQITHKAIAALPEPELDAIIAEGARLIELPREEYEEVKETSGDVDE